jgi:hypothetical protein
MKRFLIIVGLISAFVVMGSAAAQYAYTPERGTGFSVPRGQNYLQVERRANDTGYFIQIRYGGQPASAIMIRPRGRGISIRSNRSFSRDHYSSRGGWARSSGFGAMSQFVSLPPDADIRAMVRGDETGVITLFIPRRMRW